MSNSITDIESVDPSNPIHPSNQPKATNIKILAITAFLFTGFVIAEIIGALASNSLSLLGDAAAMSVDSFTYCCNLYAEWVKKKRGFVDAKTRMLLEVYIPCFSVTALLAVTGWITSDAINLLKDSDDGGDEVDVVFLFAFASGNLLIDVISVAMFMIRGRKVFESLDFRNYSSRLTMDKEDPMNESLIGGNQKFIPNLNMISAMTHIIGDTMRSSSVFVAAFISSVFNQNSTLCDAWAAVIVTITIVIAVIPLIFEIFRTYKEIKQEIIRENN